MIKVLVYNDRTVLGGTMTRDFNFPDLTPLLSPKAVAILGASGDFSKNSGRVLINLQKCRYQGKIFPVNPKYREISGLKCYPSLLAVEEPVDVALIVVPSYQVLTCLEECEHKSVKFAVIFSSGFAEESEDGRRRQKSLQEFASRTGIRIYGPNSPGLINLREKVGYSFSPQFHPENFVSGRIALITQGGGVGRAILDAQERGIGFSYWVSTGNESDLELSDFVNYFVEDPGTDVILAVVQSLRDGRKFAHVAEKAAQINKPIVVLKLGRSAEGSQAALAHTGAWSGHDEVYNALFRQKRVIRVEDLDQLLGVGAMFERFKIPTGKNIGIFSFSGSTGVLLADMCGVYGLTLPSLSAQTKEKLSNLYPSLMNASNPLDITTAVYDFPELFTKALKVFMEDPNLDIALLPFPFKLGSINEYMAASLIKVSRQCPKPVVPVWMSKGIIRERGYELLAESGLPLFYSAAHCLAAMRAYLDYAEGARKSTIDPVIHQEYGSFPVDLEIEMDTLTERKARELLAAYEVPLAQAYVAESLAEVMEFSRALGYPIILKPNYYFLSTREKVLPIRVYVRSEQELAPAYEELYRTVERLGMLGEGLSILLQQREPDRADVIIKVFEDPQFGAVIGLGLGGRGFEVEFTFRIAPLTTGDAEAWLREIKEFKTVAGMPEGEVKLNSLVDLVVKVSCFAQDWGHRVPQLQLLAKESLDDNSFRVHHITIASDNSTVLPVKSGSIAAG
ncbi:hypothetical protein SY88_15630 [Clostridiales bacterium PH28_bin88]|nr:hypothetical protein SY88_15630 [Clostridiales bacterium PH28_bin88]